MKRKISFSTLLSPLSLNGAPSVFSFAHASHDDVINYIKLHDQIGALVA
jgi:hypothetical protein